jgi:hypothetical protein
MCRRPFSELPDALVLHIASFTSRPLTELRLGFWQSLHEPFKVFDGLTLVYIVFGHILQDCYILVERTVGFRQLSHQGLGDDTDCSLSSKYRQSSSGGRPTMNL